MSKRWLILSAAFAVVLVACGGDGTAVVTSPAALEKAGGLGLTPIRL